MRQSDEDLIKRWKKQRDYSAYTELKNRNRGMVFQYVNRYKAASVPQSALEAEAWKLFDDAVNDFSPTAGAKFSTYLSYQLRKLDRYTKKYQNIARIPEALAGQIGDYDRAYNQYVSKHKKAPTHKQMSKLTGMPISHVKRLHTSRRQDLFEGMYEGNIQERLDLEESTKWLLVELRDELTPQERQVYDYLIGHNKPQITSKKELSQRLKMSPGRVSQITRNIAIKLKPHLQKRL